MGLILDGLKLMLIGMLTVYVFLLIMVFCMNVLGKILAPFAAKIEAKEKEAKKPAAGSDDALRAAAAAAAFDASTK